MEISVPVVDRPQRSSNGNGNSNAAQAAEFIHTRERAYNGGSRPPPAGISNNNRR